MFLDLILIYCLVSESPKITDEEKLRIDKNDLEAVYAGRDENTILTFGSEQKTIRDAKRHIYRDLLTLAEYFKDNKKFIDSISYVKKYSKADLPQTSFHEDGIKKAKKVTKFLREHENNKFDNIKYETEMSLSRLKNINENTSEEMNNFVKNYNEGI